MLRKARWLGLTALVALAPVMVCGAAHGAGGGWPIRREGRDVVVETAHYRIRTDLGPDVGQVLARQQEALFGELYRRMGSIKKRGEAFKRLDVLVFGTYDRYVSELGEVATNTGGIFMPGRDVLAAWGSADRLDRVLEVLRHEGTHQFVSYFIGPKCPIWLNEGLAVFYEHSAFKAGGLELGQIPPRRLTRLTTALAAGRTLPLRRMLGMSNEQWVRAVHSKASHAGLQYDQAWAMIHFLVYGNRQRYQAPLMQFIHYIARGWEPPRAWERTFGTNYAAFEAQWRDYVKQLKVSEDLDCRRRLEILGEILMHVREKTDLIKDMTVFRESLLAEKFGKWSMTCGDGLKIKSGDRDKLAALFKCPAEKRGGGPADYELVPGKKGEPPIIRCRNHPGLVLETVYNKDPQTGAMRVRVVARRADRSVRTHREPQEHGHD